MFRSTRSRFCITILLLLAFILPGWGAKLPRVQKAEEVGLDSGRLTRLEKSMQSYVDEGKVAGLVTLIIREGRVAQLKNYGSLDLAKKTPMPVDAIFRIASQSKAVTSVAAMILLEEGRLLLTDPVSKYIPEFKQTRVAIKEEGKESYQVVPAKREVTILDLLTHTSGVSYGDGPARAEYEAAHLHGWFFADKAEPVGEWIRKLAALPFDAQPGEKYIYGYNTDILGHVVEKASGMSLAEFIKARITIPLGMMDTHFFLPEEKLSRFTPVYGVKESSGIELKESPETSSYFKGPRACFSGGAGLLSTAEDYGRFLEMLRRGGELDGVRILSPKSVQLMTVNHVKTLFGEQGFGLGFSITQDLGRGAELGTEGSFGWGGAYHTTYWVDPVEKMVVLLMTQLLPAGNSDLQQRFRTMVYQSVVKSYQPLPVLPATPIPFTVGK
jgi:CubicO group peptidase (beta-lactamase class C family)